MANLLFREGKIEFLQIEELVEKAMNAHELIEDPTIDQLLDIDQWARDFVLKEINETCRRIINYSLSFCNTRSYCINP